MSQTPWWAVAIQWTLWAVVMTVVMGWLGRSRLQRRIGEDPGTLRHPTSTLIMGAIGFCLFAACTVLSALSRNGTAPWWVSTGFAVGAAMSAAMVLDYFMARHRVSDGGLAYRKLFGATGFI